MVTQTILNAFPQLVEQHFSRLTTYRKNGDERMTADAAKYGERKALFVARLTNPSDRVYIVITAA